MSNKDLANDGYLRQFQREVRSPAPLRGADTEAVLGELLGYSAEKVVGILR